MPGFLLPCAEGIHCKSESPFCSHKGTVMNHGLCFTGLCCTISDRQEMDPYLSCQLCSERWPQFVKTLEKSAESLHLRIIFQQFGSFKQCFDAAFVLGWRKYQNRETNSSLWTAIRLIKLILIDIQLAGWQKHGIPDLSNSCLQMTLGECTKLMLIFSLLHDSFCFAWMEHWIRA